jgi:hypothetical protein
MAAPLLLGDSRKKSPDSPNFSPVITATKMDGSRMVRRDGGSVAAIATIGTYYPKELRALRPHWQAR